VEQCQVVQVVDDVSDVVKCQHTVLTEVQHDNCDQMHTGVH